MDTWCLMTVLSALYGKLLLVIGVGFVTAEIITGKIPIYFYEGYFTFLYGFSLIFLAVASSCLIRNGDGFEFSMNRGRNGAGEGKETPGAGTLELDLRPGGNNGTGTTNGSSSISRTRRRASFIMETGMGFGSLFFRLGVLAFGLAAMIYCGLEFGSFFEVPSHSHCFMILKGVNPMLLLAFTFAQMYFIFMASRPSVAKFPVWTKFGLMHLVATNLGVWIKTLVEETYPNLNMDYYPNELMPVPMAFDNQITTTNYFSGEVEISTTTTTEFPNFIIDLAPSSSPFYGNASNCLRQDIMGSVVKNSAPYLCPFLIQFNLIGAAVFYIMWGSVGKPWELSVGDGRIRIPRRVDCVGASKGLFLGLFVLVTNVICLILFFVLINHHKFHRLAIYLAHLSYMVVMVVSLVAIVAAMIQVRCLSSDLGGPPEVDRPLSKLLLHIATFGTFLYSVFGILAGAMTANEMQHEPSLLLAASSSLAVVQVTIQSLFLLQMSGRWEARAALASPRPGSHAITLLLISNVTLWIVATFEIQHGLVNPIQSQFYSSTVWSVIQAVTLPLCIFYRFQSAVMLASLWKMTCLSPSK